MEKGHPQKYAVEKALEDVSDLHKVTMKQRIKNRM